MKSDSIHYHSQEPHHGKPYLYLHSASMSHKLMESEPPTTHLTDSSIPTMESPLNTSPTKISAPSEKEHSHPLFHQDMEPAPKSNKQLFIHTTIHQW